MENSSGQAILPPKIDPDRLIALRAELSVFGLIIVPREPTEEMLQRGWYGAHDEDPRETWRLMVESAQLA